MKRYILRIIITCILITISTTCLLAVTAEKLSDGSRSTVDIDELVSTADLEKEKVNDKAMLAALEKHKSSEVLFDDYMPVKKAKIYGYSFYALHPEICLYYTPRFVMKSYKKDSGICVGYDVEYISKGSGDARIEEFKEVTEPIIQDAKRYSDKDKLYYVVKWIQGNCSYTDKIFDIWSTCPYGCLVKGKATCLGYSEAMLYLMERLDVPCVMEINKTHAWNKVLIDGKWQKVDLTKGDPFS